MHACIIVSLGGMCRGIKRELGEADAPEVEESLEILRLSRWHVMRWAPCMQVGAWPYGEGRRVQGS